jgi:hypothetical protein
MLVYNATMEIFFFRIRTYDLHKKPVNLSSKCIVIQKECVDSFRYSVNILEKGEMSIDIVYASKDVDSASPEKSGLPSELS